MTTTRQLRQSIHDESSFVIRTARAVDASPGTGTRAVDITDADAIAWETFLKTLE